MFPSRLFIRNTDFNKTLTILLSPSGMHDDNFCPEQNQTPFLSKPHFPRDFMQTLDGNWFYSPNKNAMLVHLRAFPMGFGDLLGWLLLSHLLTVQATPATPPWLLDQTSQGFPSHFTLVLSPPEIICLWQNPQDTPGRKGEPCSQICALAQGLGKSPARRNFTRGGMCTQAAPQHCCAHVSTLKAALPPVKPKGSEAPSQAVLLICRP